MPISDWLLSRHRPFIILYSTDGGPAGPRITRTLDDAAVKLGPLPAMIADRVRRCTRRVDRCVQRFRAGRRCRDQPVRPGLGRCARDRRGCARRGPGYAFGRWTREAHATLV
ncbi:hypothetical protein [Gluconobacter cerevisiae]